MNLLMAFAICMGLLSSISNGATYLLKEYPTQQDNKDFDSYANDTNSTLIAHHKNGKHLETRSVNGTLAEVISTINDTLSKSYNKVIENLAHIDEELKAKIIQAQKLEDVGNQKIHEIEEQRIAFQKEKEEKEKFIINKTMEVKNEAGHLKKLELEIRDKTDQLSQKERCINETDTKVKSREEKMKMKEEELKQREIEALQKEKRNSDVETKLKSREGRVKAQEEELKKREDELQKQKSEVEKQKQFVIQKEKRNSDVETKLKNKKDKMKTKEEELKQREDEVQKQKNEVEKQRELAIQKEKCNSDIETELKNIEAELRSKGLEFLTTHGEIRKGNNDQKLLHKSFYLGQDVMRLQDNFTDACVSVNINRLKCNEPEQYNQQIITFKKLPKIKIFD
ncbi:golgin subfamily A member 6-like protein 7 [Planococcus citri]|uniref:golgin subfamily A member 6-like protein 7 n=1 Tax=Planococcus citri TaxID=170843 RepID=UPI0031F97445